MITTECLANTFTSVIDRTAPEIGELLHNCCVKAIESYWGNPPRPLQYVTIYCSNRTIALVENQKEVLREIANNLGLAQVVCMNASRLVRDPVIMPRLKQQAPHFWLELLWVESLSIQEDNCANVPSWRECASADS